ncbi:hypothetical protein J5N97_002626 [Dioscorea zingiberensis]|uniref:Uncharacterized protein n=1 Tax=Dioscorea zingiberensis TaxID=325984 RepID=A0A9D5HPE0_9LILI|nr:hypothetical protein J5N97_002626 [Dioscorea zingiberensis]
MKTPYQKHKKEEEAKKKRDEEEAARLLEQFKESFEGDGHSGPTAFVRGGMIDPNAKLRNDSEGGNSKDGVSVPKKGSRYVPTFLPSISKGREPEKKEDEKQKEKEKGKIRVIDKYVEELKLAQELRERRNQDREHRREGRHDSISAPLSYFDEMSDGSDLSGKVPGSFDDGDPQTTNLYVGNLSPQVDENFLLRTFGRFGPIASVKIMWPRTEEERRKQRNCGFVAFMNRADAQAAKDEMQGVVIFEYELKLGWGKSVPLPSQALPAPPPGQMAVRNKEGGTVILSGTHNQPMSSIASKVSDLVLTPNVPDIIVIPPEDNHLQHVIDTMALYVLDGGCTFEQAIMERSRGNPLFGFLFDLGSKEHAYYVWRLYSFAQGDTLQRWRTEPFIMITGSGRWIPPSLPSVQSPEREKEPSSTFAAAGRSRRVELERSLTDPQRDEFEDRLRSLTLERNLIKDAMGFALDNADAAGEIVEVLTESLTLKETPIPTKVARLMLVSDILHNSSAPVKNSSAYRTKFEATLPDIMESFNDLYCSITGRITAEALKERVLKVFQVWTDWFLFSDAYVNGLRATFLRSANSGVVPFHSLCWDAPEIEKRISSENPSVVKLNQDGALAIGKGAAMKELLGLPLIELEKRCRHNGLSLCGGREMMVARLLYLEDAEKQRGYERDDDARKRQSVSVKHADTENQIADSYGHAITDPRTKPFAPKPLQQHVGERISEPSVGSVTTSLHPASSEPEAGIIANKKGNSAHFLPASKWNREDDGSDDDGDNSTPALGLSYSSSGSRNAGDEPEKEEETEVLTYSGPVAHTDNMSEEHRQKLRRLEVAVLEYQESLEEQGIHNKQEIEKKVEKHRRHLQAKFGLLDSSDDQLSNKYPAQRVQMQTDQEKSIYESSKKRHRSHSRSHSPPSKSLARDKGRSNSRDHHRTKDQSYERDRERRERI